jgi:CheY-like chemotaxis protein
LAKTVLFVDDEPDQLFSMRQILKYESDDYNFLGVTSGDECLRLLEHGTKPNVILLDIMMPGMNGWEVYDRIRDNPSWDDIPIVFFTARSDDLARDTGLTLGDDYIEKPVETETLMKHLKQAIRT